MKRILLTMFFFAALAVTFTSCLKDKGFEDGTYGINDPDSQPPGVGFPLATKTQAFGLNVSSSLQAVDGYVYVNLLTGNAATSDVHVTFTNTTTADVAAYNTSHALTGTNQVLVLPPAVYNVASSIIIPAGARNAQIPINVTSTTTLDPSRTYAISLTIASSDGGYIVASNMKTLFILFSIKNRLDGHYQITGAALRAGDAVLTGSVGTYEVDFETAGANAVQWHVGSPVYWGGQASQLPGGYEPLITVDPITNLITNITSVSGITMTSPIVRTDIIGSTQRYNPATKTLYFEFTYGGGPASRLFSLVAKYLRAR
ncbi:MAG: DUF1735 domain-containing protein [Chitinophagaceae bacterium]